MKALLLIAIFLGKKSFDGEKGAKKIQQTVLTQLFGEPGRAVGYDVSRHAMSIVGIRFNKDTKSCEYLIRDSSRGSSDWEPQGQVLNELQNLNLIH
ncbi:MAG: hypothetical protein JST80_08765 [Bdellovibrionales bacterium]|nr:hypothetical protein [Bdellovibrionales bacterium]